MDTKIEKNQVFLLSGKKALATEDICICGSQKGCFILNFWEQCAYGDIDTVPVAFVPCKDAKKLHELKKNNIIIGNEADICLI